MKKIFITVAMFGCVAVYAQTDSLRSDYVVPDSTAIGLPDGNKTNKEIGLAGGRIASDDGRVELVFPPGALASPTIISIQPTTNLAPNGNGKAYWFEPSGIRFKKPVQIIFQYTKEESKICPPEWMNLAIQDNKGKWTFTEYEEWDSLGGKLKGFIHHFSGASNINSVQLRVEKFQIPVNASTYIDVVDISRPGLITEFEFAELELNNSILWYVEGEPNGDNVSGKIVATQFQFSKKTQFMSARYIAPAIMPPRNSVTIWAEIYRKTPKGKVLRKRLTAYVNVYDAYEVQVKHEFEGRVGNGSKLVDHAGFIVWVYSFKIKVDGIINYEPTVLKEGKKAGIQEKIFTKGAQGPVHPTEATQEVKISKDHPPEVYFRFKSVPILNHSVQYIARGIPTAVLPLEDKSIPMEINFLANGKEQVISVYDNQLKYKVTVTPYRAEKKPE